MWVNADAPRDLRRRIHAFRTSKPCELFAKLTADATKLAATHALQIFWGGSAVQMFAKGGDAVGDALASEPDAEMIARRRPQLG